MKHRPQKFTAMLFFLIFSIAIGKSQNSILKNYVQQGLSNNLSLQKEYLSLDKSISALREAKGLFFPQISFNSSYSVARGGRSIDFPAGDLLNPVYGTLNELTQTNQFPTNLQNVEEQLLPHNFQDTKIRIAQSIFNPTIRQNYRIKDALITVQAVKKETYQRELIREIKTAYYRYLQTLEVLKIHTETEAFLQEMLRVNQKLVKHQKATKEVIYSAELELSRLETDFLEAKKNKSTAQAYFNFLLNKDLESIIEIDANLENKLQLDANMVTKPNAGNIQNRTELAELKAATQVNEEVLQLQEASRLPTLQLVGDFGFQGFGYNIFDEQAYAFGQVALKWDLYSGGQKQAKINQAKIDKEILSNQYVELQQQLHLQVKTAYFELLTAFEKIATNRSAVKSAEAHFNVIDKKYLQGQSFFYELVAAQTQMAQTKIGLSISKFDYLVETAEWEWTIGESN